MSKLSLTPFHSSLFHALRISLYIAASFSTLSSAVIIIRLFDVCLTWWCDQVMETGQQFMHSGSFRAWRSAAWWVWWNLRPPVGLSSSQLVSSSSVNDNGDSMVSFICDLSLWYSFLFCVWPLALAFIQPPFANILSFSFVSFISSGLVLALLYNRLISY